MRQRRKETSLATKIFVGILTATSFTLASSAAYHLGPDRLGCNGRALHSEPDSASNSGGSYRRTVIGGSLKRRMNSKKRELLGRIPGSPEKAVISVKVAISSRGNVEISSATANSKGRRTDITETVRRIVPLDKVDFPPGETRVERYEIEISR